MIIKKIQQKFFSNTLKNVDEIKPDLYKSNPFAPSAKLNILKADIFQNSTSKALGMNERFAKVAEYVAIAKNTVVNAWNKAKTIKVEDSFRAVKNAITERIAKRNEFAVENLAKKPVSELKNLMAEELKAVA